MLLKVILTCGLVATATAWPHRWHQLSSQEDSDEYDFSSEEEDIEAHIPKKHFKKPTPTITLTPPPVETSQAEVQVEQETQAVVIEQATEAVVQVVQSSEANVAVVQENVNVEESKEKKLTIHHDTPKLDGTYPKESSFLVEMEASHQTEQATQRIVEDLPASQSNLDQVFTNLQRDQPTQQNVQDLPVPQNDLDQVFNLTPDTQTGVSPSIQ